jgi:hypothetical protein
MDRVADLRVLIAYVEAGGSRWGSLRSTFAARGSQAASTDSHRIHERRLVTRIFASWNQLDGWLRQVGELRRVA